MEFQYDLPDKFDENGEILTYTLSPPEDYVMTDLSKDIWKKFEDNKLSINEFTNRMNFWKDINDYIKSIYPSEMLLLGGSTLNGFGLKSSDVDMSIFNGRKVLPVTDKRKAMLILNKYLESFRRYPHAAKPKLIKSFIPLIKMHVSSFNLDIDLTLNVRVMLRNTYLLYNYSQVDWRVRPLAIIIKLWAKHYKIVGAKYQSMTCFHLILMLINFLQCAVKPPILPSLQQILPHKFHPKIAVTEIDFFERLQIPDDDFSYSNQQSLGELLIEFFDYYGNFSFKTSVISVYSGSVIPKSQYTHIKMKKKLLATYHTKCLSIEEPFEMCNAASSVPKKILDRIQAGFKKASLKLKETSLLHSLFYDFTID